MDTLTDLIFLLAFSALVNHELDAIRQAEWRFFFAPFGLSDETAYRIFVFLHAPLLVWIFASMQAQSFQIGFNIFLIIHAILHWLLRNHPLIHFNNAFSRLWIFGGALLAILHLLLLLNA